MSIILEAGHLRDPRGIIRIGWLKAGGYDAEAEVMNLPRQPRARALALLGRLANLTRPQASGDIIEAVANE